jgi:hypothetical protein
MKLFNGGLKWGSGIAVGAGVVILAPIVIPVVTGVLRSLAKATIKGSMIAYEKAKVATAETIESVEDIAAEAKAELAESNKAE